MVQTGETPYSHPAYTGTKNFLPVGLLEALPPVLEYSGEFGPELLLFLPFITWAAYAGLLINRKVVTHHGMSLFYRDLPIGEYEEKDNPRDYVEPKNRPFYLPIKDEHSWDWLDRSPFHMWRDHRKLYRSVHMPLPKAFEGKPMLIIHNKYNDEWRRGPINYIPLDVLDELFSVLKEQFTIVYIRHGMFDIASDYSTDHNSFMSFDDVSIVNKHGNIHLFDELYDTLREQMSVNQFKNALYSRCYYFFSTQGGGAHHCALYSGSVLVINNVWGPEINRSYGDGFYSFIANPAPVRLVCLAPDQLILAAKAVTDSKIIDGRVHLKQASTGIVDLLSPFAQREAYFAAGREGR